jgi:hypothetical protein
VSSPRSEELDENGLAASHLVEVVRGELHSGGGDHEGEKKEGTQSSSGVKKLGSAAAARARR